MKKLNLKVDEWVSIMATTIDGAYNAGSLQVTGSFSMGNADADNFYIMLPISFAQNLLNTDGVDKFIVNLKDTEMTTATVNWLKNRFDEMGLRVEIKSWSDLAAYYHQVRGLYEIIFFFLSTVIFILVFLSILGIMSMTFLKEWRRSVLSGP
ncbi:MAG: putative transport system permease protein [Halanaerobiales bacterium]|nr:putative transport system permease protein [Halanaerobiales bacterium]